MLRPYATRAATISFIVYPYLYVQHKEGEQMNPNIFREYDIRGVSGIDLTPDVDRLIGKGIGAYMVNHGVTRIAVGRDGRISSPEIWGAMVEGLRSVGVNVVDLGIIPTPLTYYAAYVLDVGGTVMITGSHNPPDHNGFKITMRTGSVFGQEIQVIKDIIFSASFPGGSGTLESYDIVPQYLDDMAGRLSLSRPVTFGVDCGNGVGGITAGPLLERLGCRVKMLYDEIDGHFPNHHPDPTLPESMVDLQKLVVDKRLEVGFAFDGDADRIGMVDENGKIIWGDQILAIMARSVLKEVPGSIIMGEVKCSQLLYDDIKKHGGIPLMYKVGHSLAKQKMLEVGALLGGEQSGHIYVKHRFFGYDDAIYNCGRLLEIVAAADIPVSRFLEDWPPMYNTPEIRVDCSDDSKFEIVEKVKQRFEQKYPVNAIDGMRVTMPGGWGLVRPSNTQPVLTLRFEADSEQRMKEIQDEVERELTAVMREYC